MQIAEAAAEAESVRKATASDRERIVPALAAGFYDDPVFGWYYRRDPRRMRQLEGAFGWLWRFWARHELIYTTDSIAGAAAWFPPDQWRLSIGDQLRYTPSFVGAVGVRDTPRTVVGFNLLESKHPRKPPHYYLQTIALKPEWQGRGIGSALLRPMLDRCDRERMPAYLEATTPRGREMYARHGFAVTGEFDYPNGPRQWLMWREPGAG